MPNRLASEPSLYLRQHADNPVDWYPWGDEALARARELQRPILLSIGYSACHWCHVMARESFAEPAVAALMNAGFVNIKVDREERPDLDRIYQLAHQALQQRGGGWPLTVFLDPATLVPFYVGTYFPPQARFGLPSFSEVLQALTAWHRERPQEVARQVEALGGFLQEYAQVDAHRGAFDGKPIERAYASWRAQADRVHGGSQGAPKFPHAGQIELEWRAGDPAAREHALHTLRAMADGGLQDHVGGGFFRYCVDADWNIPHFEKMLYDNAQLLPLYAQAAAQIGDAPLREAAIGIVRWLQEEMALPGGGFAAALDADSEHEEGRYYVWQPGEFAAALTVAERDWLQRHFGLDAPANFEGRAWHLRIRQPLDAIAAALGVEVDSLRERRAQSRKRLRLVRAQRVPPARDDKLLASWNGLLLSGLARAGQALHRADWLGLAQGLADSLQSQLWRGNRLFAVAHAGEPRQRALLDDHAALLLGQLDLLEARWRSADLDFAVALADALLDEFEDREQGGFFLTPHAYERLPQRPKPFLDDSTPAGNGLAVQGLLRLGWWLGETRYLAAAERALRAGWSALSELPQAAPSLLLALRDWLQPPPYLVARFADHNEAERWLGEIDALRHSGAHVLTIPAAEPMLPGALAQKRWLAGGRVYWCEGLQCLPRLDSPVALAAQRAKGGGER